MKLKLTKAEMINALIEWAMQSRPNLDRALNMLMDSVEKENGLVARSTHQRRRGRPPKVRLTKEQDLNNRGWETVKKKRLGRPPTIKVED